MGNMKYIVGAGIILLLIVVAVIVIKRHPISQIGTNTPGNNTEHRGVAGDPTDVTYDFYSSWLSRRKVTDVNQDTKNPLDSMALSPAMQQKLSGFNFSSDESVMDPVLCQTTLPKGFRTQTVFNKDSAAQILVLPSDKSLGGQAIVSFEEHDGLWEITDITCNAGEQAPDIGEFSFDQEGFLLKDSLPSTFDKSNWYLIFEQDGTKGHTAPLILDGNSMCATGSESELVCNTATFKEAMHAHVQGQMSEAGVEVKHIEILQ